MFGLRKSQPKPILITSLDVLLDDERADVRTMAYDNGDIDAAVSQAVVSPSSDLLEQVLVRGFGRPAQPKPLASFPLTPERNLSGNLYHLGSSYYLAVKGSPEVILQQCDLTDTEREAATLRCQQLAASGARIVAVADLTSDQPIERLDNLIGAARLQLVGFIAVTPVIDPRARRVILSLRQRGSDLYLISGEHTAAATAITREAQLIDRPSAVIDMYHQSFKASAPPNRGRVFCRANPEQKRQLTTQLQSSQPNIKLVATTDELVALQ